MTRDLVLPPSFSEYVRWRDPKYPNMPPVWFPIDRENGKVLKGCLICNTKPKGKIVGDLKFSGQPIFSKPIVTFYETEEEIE